MTLLELSAEELQQKIESELASNPALELSTQAQCPHCQKPLPRSGRCPRCTQPQSLQPDQPIIFVSPRTDFGHRDGFSSSKDELLTEEWAAAEEDLPTYVLRQIAPELASEDRELAAHILTNLDDDGLLCTPLIEIARYLHVPISRLQNVINLVQRAEPVGVGSPNPQQALLVQLRVLSENRPVPELAFRAIQDGMELLSRRAYTELGKLLGISSKATRDLANFITDNLNPFPARAHWGDIRHATSSCAHVYQNPDIIISRLYEKPGTPLVVEIVSPYAGLLRVSSLFRQALPKAPPAKSEQWQSEMDNAVLLIKCLQQRDHTLVRLMKRLVVIQRRYLLEGDAHMLPVTRAKLADELEVHESTVSRAVSGKAVQLPNKRIVPLSKLFDRSLHIRTALKNIVEQEKKPLSDTQIAKLLSEQGFSIARRTVAKYRSMEGILPARLRQQTILTSQ
jgi:RNA polymerase sigma-54 factor